MKGELFFCRECKDRECTQGCGHEFRVETRVSETGVSVGAKPERIWECPIRKEREEGEDDKEKRE